MNMDFFDIAIGVLFGIVLVVAIGTKLGDFDGADIANACRDNRGVEQVAPTTWTAPFNSKAIVVCKDGDIAIIR